MSSKEIPSNTLIEIFGHNPDDGTENTRLLWEAGVCPFTMTACKKINHSSGIVYGTCSARTGSREVIICPNRLYANKYEVIRRVSEESFGGIPFLMFSEYWENRDDYITQDVVVALGQNSGREIKLGTSLSMDWVLARIKNGKLLEYVGIEVQSIDITGNYRDNWHYYKRQDYLNEVDVPCSENGYNWANVHKRLIPQLIRKGQIYANSKLVRHGLFFILPEVVYQKFESVLGPLAYASGPSKGVMTVHTYELGDPVSNGNIRLLRRVRNISFLETDFANAFIAGLNLPSGDMLDDSVRRLLGVS